VERVCLWFLLNILFTIAGILHILLQRQSSRPPIIDTAAVAITTDASRLLDDEKVKDLKWRNMSYVTSEDVFGPKEGSGEMILLKLEQDGDGFSLVKKDQ
jgi:hypothetical protein